MAVLAFLVAGMVTLAGAAGYVQHQTQSALDVAQGELTTVSEALADAKDEIAQAEERLNRRKAKLVMAQAELDEKTRRLRAVNQSLAAAQVRQSGLESTLDDAFSQLDLQASQIETLKTCLDGVSNAFVYAWKFEDDEALASLLAVEVSCNHSFELFE